MSTLDRALLTVKLIARELGIAEATARRRTKAGEFGRVYRSGKRLYVRTADFLAHLEPDRPAVPQRERDEHGRYAKREVQS